MFFLANSKEKKSKNLSGLNYDTFFEMSVSDSEDLDNS